MLWCMLVLLPACASHLPPIPYPAVPSAPLVRSLDEQRQRFQSLKALARVETVRKGKRRVYESVAIVQRGLDRLRIEGYGPLGETLFVLLWDGTNVLVQSPDTSGVRSIGPGGLERLLGVGLTPEDLCAVLVGSAPPAASAAGSAAGCSTDGRCALDAEEGGGRWRVLMRPRSDGAVVIDAIERYRGASIAFQVRYEGTSGAGAYVLPRRVVVQDTRQQAALTVEYLDAEVNIPVSESLFQPGGPSGSAP